VLCYLKAGICSLSLEISLPSHEIQPYDSIVQVMDLPQWGWRTILKLTYWVRGANPSTLERKRAVECINWVMWMQGSAPYIGGEPRFDHIDLIVLISILIRFVTTHISISKYQHFDLNQDHTTMWMHGSPPYIGGAPKPYNYARYLIRGNPLCPYGIVYRRAYG
jgi:hypothetical protein